VQDFSCPHCGQQLAFENSRCLRCGSVLGFDVDRRGFAVLDNAPDGPTPCANRALAGCNWLAMFDEPGRLCRSCVLTRTRPADDDHEALLEYGRAESAKRRLVLELVELGLPLVADNSPDGPGPRHGVCFDLLSSSQQSVITGHDEGVITLDLAEGDDVHREQLRTSMDEPYRTLLGHFRHEIGHYYFTTLIVTDQLREEFSALFGDPDADYQAAIDRHYSQGPPPNWRQHFISAYATMHPAEDWAETFAHYLHIRDTIDTAAAFGFAASIQTLGSFDRIIAAWLPLTWSLNMINRSMGHPDLYPFVIPPDAVTKLEFVHGLIESVAVPVGVDAGGLTDQHP
jgi:hypothetical protein